jgi:hypothetical protein
MLMSEGAMCTAAGIEWLRARALGNAGRLARVMAVTTVLALAGGCSSPASTEEGSGPATTLPARRTSDVLPVTDPVSASSAGSDDVSTSVPVEASPERTGSPPSADLSIEALRLSLMTASDLAQQAVDRRVQACMASFGYEYLAEPPATGVGQANLPARIWDLPQPELAPTNGYLVPGVDDAPELPPEPETSAEYDSALWGKIVGQWEDSDPPEYAGAPVGGDIYDGCLPTARTAIVGDGQPEQLYLDHDLAYRLNSLVSEASDRLFADPTWLELEAEWVSCMRTSGYVYDSLFGPASADWGRDRPSTVERETAIADAACKKRLDLAARADALYEETLRALMDEREGELIEIAAAIDGLQYRATVALDNP